MFAILVAAAADTGNVQSKNPILPAGNELVWGTFSFLVLFVLMAKFALPTVRKGMQARTDRIRGDLATAEQAKGDAQNLLDDYQRQLADARSESNRIIEEARQAADGLRRELMAKAEADAAELRQRATADIEAAKDRAMAELRSQLTTLTIDLAERVVKRNLDRESNAALVDDYITSIGRA
jgi:F-type H+-transporting ATPase subunit b